MSGYEQNCKLTELVAAGMLTHLLSDIMTLKYSLSSFKEFRVIDFAPGTILGAGDSVSKSTPSLCIDGGLGRMVDSNQMTTWMTVTYTPRCVLWTKGTWTLRGCDKAPNGRGVGLVSLRMVARAPLLTGSLY